MQYFVFKTAQYEEEAQRHAQMQAFDAFRMQREKEGIPHQRIEELLSFPGNYVKKEHGNFRSIFSFQDFEIEGSLVRIYIALRVMPRGSREYEKRFLHSQDRDIITGLTNVDWDSYKSNVHEIIKASKRPIEKPKLTDSERFFVGSYNDLNYKILDFFIYESKEWCDFVKKQDDSYLECLRVAIIKILNGQDGNCNEVLREAIPHQNQDILYTFNGDAEWNLLRIVPSGQVLVLDLHRQNILRGYPASIVLSEFTITKWQTIEKNKNTNLVLSSEEKDIVTKQQKEYPLFISGRAGSGKTTVLQYMFAEIIVRYLQSNSNKDLLPPLYLSYSPSLIKNAKDLAKDLFNNDHVYSEEISKKGLNYKFDILPCIENEYREFSEVVKACIRERNPEMLARKFDDSKKVTFAKFKKLWRDHFKDSKEARTKYDPSVSWHVIRTYIKGWQSDTLLGRDDYELVVPKNDRGGSVSEETYKLVYDEVWTKWYAKKDYWDEQDLVRECLCPSDGSNAYVTPQFSAIFCDEAQDFTRIEVDFILKLSCFSNRTISTVEEIKQIPFVFAGDEFQTLNPTGFSWDMLRAHFVERLFTEVGLGHKKDDSSLPEPVPLSYNYRSTTEIVKFGNNIQLLRASRFRNECTPQSVHSNDTNRSVFRLSPNQRLFWKLLEENEIDLIVPAVNGQKPEDFVKGTEFGDLIIESNITIFDTVQAKGLEYENVAVYGFDDFGKNKALDIDELIKWFQEDYNIKDDDIDLKYQMCNTYVAVTRAKNKLFIMSDSDRPSFWDFADKAIDPTKVDLLADIMLEKLGEEWSKDSIGYIEPGDENDITSENLGNWEETAHQREINAEPADDDMMEKAAILYRNHEHNKDADRCSGKAARMRGEYERAIALFEKSHEYDLAVYTLWMLFSDKRDYSLVERIAGLADKTQDSYSRAIVRVCKGAIPKNIPSYSFFSLLADIESCVDKDHSVSLAPWQSLIDYICQKTDSENVSVSDFGQILEYQEILFNKYGLKVQVSLLAKMAFSIGDYQKAVKLWNNARLSSFPHEYYKANLEITPYPENLKYYEKAGLQTWKQSVISAFVEHGTNLDLDLFCAEIICKAIFEESANEDYLKFLPQLLTNAIFAQSKERFFQYLERARSIGETYNEDSIDTLIALGFDELRSWATPTIDYKDKNAKAWFSTVNNIRGIRNISEEIFKTEDFKKSSALWIKYCTVSGNDGFKALLHYEMGLKMENRGIHVDAAIFYEWAKKQTTSRHHRTILEQRWIACKRKQAGRDGLDSPHWKAADEKMKELGLAFDYDIPDFPCITFNQWVEIVQNVLQIKPDVLLHEERKEIIGQDLKIQDSIVKEQKTIGAVVPVSPDIPIIEVDGYELILRPKKNDIRIEYLEDRISIGIGNGRIPTDTEDFIVKESRLYRRDGEEIISTPFAFSTTSDGKLHIKIEKDA